MKGPNLSHCNITMRDRYSTTERLLSQIDILTVEKKRLEALLDDAESNLRSIFERVKDSEVVYLDYPDGSRLYLSGSPDAPKSP